MTLLEKKILAILVGTAAYISPEIERTGGGQRRICRIR